MNKCPDKLYKYKPFNEFALGELVLRENVYFADPEQFNDPLDCKPPIVDDGLEIYDLEKLFQKMLLQSNGYNKSCLLQLKELQQYAEKFGDIYKHESAQKEYRDSLVFSIEELFAKVMLEYGVFSLAEDWNSPVMWSHYANDHKGICIQYDMRGSSDVRFPKAIQYDLPRSLKMGTLFRWIMEDSDEAKRGIEKIFFYSKALQWAYEKEWRLIYSEHGTSRFDFIISAVLFGMRCDTAVKKTIGLLTQEKGIPSYDVYPDTYTFQLKKRLNENGELNIFPCPCLGNR